MSPEGSIDLCTVSTETTWVAYGFGYFLNRDKIVWVGVSLSISIVMVYIRDEKDGVAYSKVMSLMNDFILRYWFYSDR